MSKEEFDGFSRRACAWPRRVSQGPARLIAEEELKSWILFEDERLLVIGKPGDVVCHPSKAGPWSSLVGAAREYTQLETVHLVFRLDRETSGVVVIAKDAKMASRLQVAMQERKVGKVYRAIVWGELKEAVTVERALGDDVNSPVFVKSAVVEQGGQRAVTHFAPEGVVRGAKQGREGDGAPAEEVFSLVRVVTETGRKHQIRAHAQWLGYPIVGDKIYGPDDRLYLEFIDGGWTPAMAGKLLLPRQALHCAEIDLRAAGVERVFVAPLAGDMRRFWEEKVERI